MIQKLRDDGIAAKPDIRTCAQRLPDESDAVQKQKADITTSVTLATPPREPSHLIQEGPCRSVDSLQSMKEDHGSGIWPRKSRWLHYKAGPILINGTPVLPAIVEVYALEGKRGAGFIIKFLNPNIPEGAKCPAISIRIESAEWVKWIDSRGIHIQGPQEQDWYQHDYPDLTHIIARGPSIKWIGIKAENESITESRKLKWLYESVTHMLKSGKREFRKEREDGEVMNETPKHLAKGTLLNTKRVSDGCADVESKSKKRKTASLTTGERGCCEERRESYSKTQQKRSSI